MVKGGKQADGGMVPKSVTEACHPLGEYNSQVLRQTRSLLHTQTGDCFWPFINWQLWPTNQRKHTGLTNHLQECVGKQKVGCQWQRQSHSTTWFFYYLFAYCRFESIVHLQCVGEKYITSQIFWLALVPQWWTDNNGLHWGSLTSQ